MGKLKFEELRYIVMEGGGARGNTYLGAIRAIEKQFAKRAADSNDSGVFLDPDRLGTRAPGIMDYHTLEQGASLDEHSPYIRGAAGASAGAITAFAIALGLNEAEVKAVLDYDFNAWLREKHVAKYRMINSDSELSIGEDEDKSVGGIDDPFDYDLKSDSTEVKGSFRKAAKRSLLVNVILKVVLDGIASNVGQILKLINKTSSGNQDKSGFAKFVEKTLNFFSGIGGSLVGALTRVVYQTGVSLWLFKWFLPEQLPAKFDANVIASVFADRGLYSGFRVREFFYDILLFAATRDTFFQRRLLQYYNNKPFSVRISSNGSEEKEYENAPFTLTQDLLDFPDFKLGARAKTNFGKEATAVLKHLESITFRELYEILGLDFAAAGANFTSNSPLFFSDQWTPQYRVLEAVASSMAIPPAIRPVFNESDVFYKVEKNKTREMEYPRNATTYHNGSRAIAVKNTFVGDFDKDSGQVKKDNPHKFVDKDGNFTKENYALYEVIVKKALQLYLLDPSNASSLASDTQRTYVDLNNLIELSSTLPTLRDIVVGKRIHLNGTNREDDVFEFAPWVDMEIRLNDYTYVVTKELLTFFYNAQFKGLFIDGGYFMNIPFNYFRKGSEPLDGVFAIKLDGSFSPAFMLRMNQKIKAFKIQEKKLVNDVDVELAKQSPNRINLNLVSDLTDAADDAIDVEFEKLVAAVLREFKVYFINQSEVVADKISERGKPDNKRIRKKIAKTVEAVDRKAVVKVIEQWIADYGAHNHIKPWAEAKAIIAIAFEGYSYGSRRGQIRNITDHDHIISLYDFGVGTYDFELSKVRPLAAMSQFQAEADTNTYFDIRFIGNVVE
jgi:predicted acylesterase/phospholipase RssA